ncbi:uncharacterized protein E0L32_002633 [Thyridium curvatum]|uniref:Translation initiation factor IF-2, mitochondrial n=1 Tax=Thyridium curvatum TaxID=1093900 RepID=A0A507BH61_9PEZI|nr:uncharacterized protein E0L32_002633 [Thyridium curvatum]TPX18124.1 hypothetical protein E0L32_002633 [Thyridium curvatum]
MEPLRAPGDAPRPPASSSWGASWGSSQPTRPNDQATLPPSKREDRPLDALLPHEMATRSRALEHQKNSQSSQCLPGSVAEGTSTNTRPAPKPIGIPSSMGRNDPGGHSGPEPRPMGTPMSMGQNAPAAKSLDTRSSAPTKIQADTEPNHARPRARPFGRLDHSRSGLSGGLSTSNAIQKTLGGIDLARTHERPSHRQTPRAAPSSRTPHKLGSLDIDAAPIRQEWGQLTRRKSPSSPRQVPVSETSLSRAPLGPGNVFKDSDASWPGGRAVDTIGASTATTTPGYAGSSNMDTEQRGRKQRSQRDRRSVEEVPPSPADPSDVRSDRREREVAHRSVQRGKAVSRRHSRYQEEEDEDYDEEAAERAEARRRQKEAKRARKERELEAKQNQPTPIFLPELISVANLGVALGVKPDLFLEQLAELGFEDISQDSIMSGETAALIAQEYGFEPSVDTGESVDLKPRPAPADPSALPTRPPIVTIMGHVDHGKTTMLDWLRKTSVAAQEHGGITQHIGAFSVRLSAGRQITFLDTPGHAAFLTMRQRGANVTDIVILVVAADDSVKPQTLEALKHAQSANVPIIVAINKIDKDEARVEQVKADLARHGVEIEDYGGDVQVVCVSGKTGQGMPDLEENILTLSEILDMRAESDGMAEGWVLESSIKPVGKVATVLVKRGTLRKGDIIVAGTTWARVRSLRSEAGVELEEAPPSTPVEILGWREPPAAGDQVLQAPDEGRAKDAAHYRQELRDREKSANELALQEKREKERGKEKEKGAASPQEVVPDGEESSVSDEAPGSAVVNFTVKGDVMGSVEAVCAAVLEIGNNEVRPAVLRSAPGQITEFDIEHAATSNSSIINFNNAIPGNMKRKAEEAGVDILDHTVIYHLTDAVRAKLSEKLTPTISTRVLGEAEVLQVFPINVKGRVYKNIAGCRVRNGQVTRSALYRVMRNGEKVFDGKLESLKHGKKDVAEMRKGAECGLSFDEWQDFKQGDQIQAYEEIKERRSL